MKQKNKGALRERRREFFINNSLYLFLIAAIVAIVIYDPRFLSVPSLVNILSLSAANLPLALGIAGAIILSGTDLSAGRAVGLIACVSASLLQTSGYPNKMFPALQTLPLWAVILLALGSEYLGQVILQYGGEKYSCHNAILLGIHTFACNLIHVEDSDVEGRL